MNIEFQDETTERTIFHYNRASNEDATIPMWVVKRKGQTHYVHHLEASIGFKTKNTPSSDHTRGSLQFNKSKLRIEKDDSDIVTAYVY